MEEKERKKSTKRGPLSYFIFNKKTGTYSLSTSAEKASRIHKGLTPSKIRMWITEKKENCTKGDYIILEIRGSNKIHTEEALIELLK